MQSIAKNCFTHVLLCSTALHPMTPPPKTLCMTIASNCLREAAQTPCTPTMKERWEREQIIEQPASWLEQEDPKCDLNRELCSAARQGNTAKVLSCIDHGAKVNAYADRALRCAISEDDHAETVQVLLKKGAYVHAMGNDPLIRIFRNHTDLLFQKQLEATCIEPFQNSDDTQRLILLKKMCLDFDNGKMPCFFKDTLETFKVLWEKVILELKERDNTGKLSIIKKLLTDLKAFDSNRMPSATTQDAGATNSSFIPPAKKLLDSEEQPPSYAAAIQVRL